MSALPSKRQDRDLPEILRGLRIPLIAAPMLTVSGPDLAIAACRSGVVGSFPALNARSIEELDAWFARAQAEAGSEGHGPLAANLVMRNPRLGEEVQSVVRHGIKLVITCVGSPKPILPALHDHGITVLADVATVEHAEKAIAAGVDGLILLTAGAGGQTGWMNGMAFVRAVRRFYDGPVVMAGGISDGVALRAATVLGCDLAYMGTRFIAAQESMATDIYRDMLVHASMDDVVMSRAFTGIPGNYLRQSIVACGLDPVDLDEAVSAIEAAEGYGKGAAGPQRWKDIWSAGHSVSGVASVQTVEEIVAETQAEYEAAV